MKIGGGDYGNLTFTKEQAESGIWVADPGNIRPPKIESLTLSYLLPFEAPEHCLTYNNLHFSRFTERCKSDDAHPSPVFLRLEEQHPSFYLGFDRKLENGPVSIFFFLREQAGLADSAPSLTWEFYAGENTWAEIQVLDHTRGLTRTGTIEFVFPKDTKKTSKFGNDLYWIRAVDDGDAFVPKSSAFSETVRLPAREQPFNHRAGETFLPPCRKSILGAEWPPPEAGAAEDTHPKIEAIFLNTTWGIQVESIRDEILGSSSGMGAQSFSLAKKPVLSEENLGRRGEVHF